MTKQDDRNEKDEYSLQQNGMLGAAEVCDNARSLDVPSKVLSESLK